MYFNSEGSKEVTYDAIVVGSGISGGWAAKELCEKGLKTIVLERGRMVKHGDYPTANMEDWELPNRNRMTPEQMKEYKIQERTGYTMSPAYQHWWPKDTENPYTEAKPFDWIRAYHVGGRSLLWGRQSYRLGDLDFEANAKEGIAVDWPVRYADIAPWYDYVETFAGISGQNEGLSQLPDGKFLPPMEYNCIEVDVKKKIEDKLGIKMIIMRMRNQQSGYMRQIHPKACRVIKAGRTYIQQHIFINHSTTVCADILSAMLAGVVTMRAFAPQTGIAFACSRSQKSQFHMRHLLLMLTTV